MSPNGVSARTRHGSKFLPFSKGPQRLKSFENVVNKKTISARKCWKDSEQSFCLNPRERVMLEVWIFPPACNECSEATLNTVSTSHCIIYLLNFYYLSTVCYLTTHLPLFDPLSCCCTFSTNWFLH